MSIGVGGFGLSGVPFQLIEAIRDSGACDLTIVSNNLGIDGVGLGILLDNDQISRVVASYVGENKLFADRYLTGAIQVEFVPQGSLAERLRAGGAGIPAFYTKTGVGTPVAEGKPTAEFDGIEYLLERSIATDLGLVRAHTSDAEGNLTYRLTARNFNPVVATAAAITVAEVERFVDSGEIQPDNVVTPGIFVDRVVVNPNATKHIEQRTIRSRPIAA